MVGWRRTASLPEASFNSTAVRRLPKALVNRYGMYLLAVSLIVFLARDCAFHDFILLLIGGNGGGLYVGNGNGAMKQEQGLMSFENCTAGGLGGGLYLGSKRAGQAANNLYSLSLACSSEGCVRYHAKLSSKREDTY